MKIHPMLFVLIWPTSSVIKSRYRRHFRGSGIIFRQPHIDLERHVRRLCGRMFRQEAVIPSMIDRIKQLFSQDESENTEDASLR